jgi:aryl-phospho-beta-D-glucosidase BglC (GH1 family)
LKTRKHCQNLKLLFVLTILLLSLASSAQGLKASGKKIVDQNGNEVILRGMGLGGWMLQEPYMMEMTGFAGTQWQIKTKIEALIGTTNTVRFYDAWHANHCTRADIDSMAAWGFNSVRLPMHYNLYTLPIEKETVPGQNTWLEKGFVMTDSLIKWCKANQMYVILDLHAAPGAQGKDAAISDGDPSKPSLWDSEANKNKTIALWKKLAERYVDEPWVGAYDLINEPNWSFTADGNQNGCSENLNAPLKQLYMDITAAIRQVDTKHMIIIEGNCWGNNYNGIVPTWDNNMALSFHKYWSNNDQGSIQGIINLRNLYNIPIWLGESGENSNTWFTDALQLVEKNGIGWAWWPLKKINSIVGPLTIVKTAEYQTLLDYWNKGGTAPSVTFATNALMKMAENAKIQNCIFRKDIIDAMFRQVQDSTTLPFKNHTIPGVIMAVDYDMGRNGKAYMDTDIADYHVSSGSYTNWNSGNTYRNDGVDIGTSYDPEIASTINYVGWTADSEWLQYTLNVDSTAAYTVKFRYAALDNGAKIKLFVNDADMTGPLSLPATGGYQSWVTFPVNDVILYKGRQKIKVLFEKAGANLSTIGFFLNKKIEEIAFKPASAETHLQTEIIYLSCNKIFNGSTVSSSNFRCTVNGGVVNITSLTINSENPYQLIINLGQQIFDIDNIFLSYSGGTVSATDGTLLQNFSNLKVVNNLPVYTIIPGKIEAEAYSVNQGLVFETCTDTGGGKNAGFTNSGDFLDYRVRVVKTSKYTLEVRAACFNAAGKIEVQQINSSGAIVNSVQLNIPVTGGWQTWQTFTTSIELTEGIWTLRVKILQPEFNLNWFRFTENSFGIQEDKNSVFSVFPNPANDEVSILVPGSTGHSKTIKLWSSGGTLVRTMEMAESEVAKKLIVGNMPKGLYIVELEMSGKTIRNKLVIQ